MSIEEFTWFVMTGCEGGETLILPVGQRHSCEQRAGGVISGAQQILWVTAKPFLGGAKGKIQVFLRKCQTQSVCLGAQEASWPNSACVEFPRERRELTLPSPGREEPLRVPRLIFQHQALRLESQFLICKMGVFKVSASLSLLVNKIDTCKLPQTLPGVA